MFGHLLESSGQRERHNRWTTLSIAIHCVLVTAAAALTARDAMPKFAEPVATPVVYLAPAAPPTVRTAFLSRAECAFVCVSAPTITLPRVAIPTPDVYVGPTSIESSSPSTSTGIVPAIGGQPSSGADGVFSAAAVDRVVSAQPGNPRPEYPQMLRDAGIEGHVLVRFVVDSAGRVRSQSIDVLEATHAFFADAVRRWLPKTRYVPAELGGRAVSQVVEQHVNFAVAK